MSIYFRRSRTFKSEQISVACRCALGCKQLLRVLETRSEFLRRARGIAFHRRGVHQQSRSQNKSGDLWQSLRLAINKVIHDDNISVGCSQDAIARRNSDEKNASCVKPDSQERKASAIGRSGQYVPAKEQIAVNIEVFDLRAVVNIHVGEYGAEPCARCRMGSSRYKEKCLRDVAIQGAEELLGTERAKELGIDTVDIPKSDRSVCRVDTVGAYLKPCS